VDDEIAVVAVGHQEAIEQNQLNAAEEERKFEIDSKVEQYLTRVTWIVNDQVNPGNKGFRIRFEDWYFVDHSSSFVETLYEDLHSI